MAVFFFDTLKFPKHNKVMFPLKLSPRVLIILALTVAIAVAIPLTVILVRQAREPGSRASGAGFTITSVTQVTKEIGTDGVNNTPAVDVCGADLGSMFDWNGRTYIAFGDTFGCPLTSGSQPNWRNNTLAYTTDSGPSNGINFDAWITSGGAAKELFHADAGAITAIPTYGVSIGSTGYLFYMQVTNWSPWTCNYSSVAKSTDSGQNWTKLSGTLTWSPGNFNQVALYKSGGYVYVFGIPCGRAGGVKLARVLEGSLENKASYQYLTSLSGSTPTWTTNSEGAAITIVPPAVGELSVAWDNYLGAYVMMYLNDDPPGGGRGIELRTSPNLWGPWSDYVPVTTGASYPCLYAPFMSEGYQENSGQTVYFRMSRYCPGFNPYSTYLMKLTFQKTATPAPSVDLKVNGQDGPITISYNSSSSLSWTSTNATSCSASGAWSGNQNTSGSFSTGNLVSTKTYTLSCSGTGGTVSDSVTINVAAQGVYVPPGGKVTNPTPSPSNPSPSNGNTTEDSKQTSVGANTTGKAVTNKPGQATAAAQKSTNRFLPFQISFILAIAVLFILLSLVVIKNFGKAKSPKI